MDVIEQFRPYRPLLWGISAVGFVGLNGVFLYWALLYPATLVEALRNPIGAVFILEALFMTGVLAWIVWVADLKKPGGGVFVLLSIAGGLAFSVPTFLLLHLRVNASERT